MGECAGLIDGRTRPSFFLLLLAAYVYLLTYRIVYIIPADDDVS